ncbi:MAG: MATE family efflux transporter [Clostridiales bacterium]|nr:MATE family efflux transporter [Clostridiales bacterium]
MQFERDKSFYKKILLIGGPVSAQQIITVGVNLMDNVMLGQLDEVALSSSTIAVQVHTLFNYMCMGMGMGATVLLSRYWGAKDLKNFKKTLAWMYRFCLLVSVTFTVVVALFPAQIMGIFTVEPDVIAEGVRYLKWALPCFLLYGFSLTTTITLRNSGKMYIPLGTSIGAFFINIFFNWVFIFGKLGAPEMGVAGAALGTLISRAFEFTVICGYFFVIDKRKLFCPRNLFMPCRDLFREYLHFSLPVMVSDTLLGLGNSAITAVSGHIGIMFMSANSITTVVQHISTILSSGLGQAALIITGNTLGEGDIEKTRRQSNTLVVVAFIFGVIVSLFILAAGPVIVGFYQIEPETKEIALSLLRALSVVMIFMLPSNILTKGILRGGGDTTFLMVADVVFLWAVSVPLGWCAGILWGLPPFWIMFFMKIENIFKLVLCLFRMRRGRWIKQIRTDRA